MPEQSSPSVSSGKNREWQCRKSAEESAMIWVEAWLIALLAPKEKKVYILFLFFLEFLETLLHTFKTTLLL